MHPISVKKFPVGQTIREVMTLNSMIENGFIYSCKIDVPKEIELNGNKGIFQELIFSLINRAKLAYQKSGNLQNKIILLTSKLENETEISFSVTDGGDGLSFISKRLLQQSILTLGDGFKESNLQKINKKIKKEFSGYLKIISKKNVGTTIKCFFPLHQ